MSTTRSADGGRPNLGIALIVIATAQLMVVLEMSATTATVGHLRGQYSGDSLASRRYDNRRSGRHRHDIPVAGDPASTSNT